MSTAGDKLRATLNLARKSANKGEAFAAMAAAYRIAKKYGLKLEDFENDTQEIHEYHTGAAQYSGQRSTGRSQWAEVDYFAWKLIAKFAGVQVRVTTDDDGDNAIQYFGHDAAVVFAEWLRLQVSSVMDIEWRSHLGYLRMVGRAVSGQALKEEKYGFHLGFAAELRERMEFLHKPDLESETGRELAIRSAGMLAQRAKEAGFEESKGGNGRQRNVSSGGYAAGREAGKRVSLGQGVASQAARQISKA